MQTLRVVHRWIGLVVALPVVLVALSGGLLVFRDPYYRLQWPVLAQSATAAEHAIQPRVLQQIDGIFGDGVRTIKFPRAGVNAFHVYLTEEREAFVDPRTGEVLTVWTWRDEPAAFLFDLHAHLLMGARGELLNGYVALVLVFLSLSGFVLWFPRRRTAFRLRHAVPATVGSGAILRSHAASGVMLLPAIALFAATGAGLVFYEQAGAIAARLLDDAPAAAPDAVVAPTGARRVEWARILDAARGTLPESGPTMYYRDRPGNAVLTFRKRLPGEWHPNGRSYVLVDPYTGQVVQAIDARRQGAGTRLMHALYPLHAAKIGGAPLAVVAVVAAAGLAWLAVGGSWTYISRTLPRAARRQPSPMFEPSSLIADQRSEVGDRPT